jgi:hypothetical protein
MTPLILRPGNGVPFPGQDQNAPTLVTCNGCGHQILLPTGLAPIAAEQHHKFCLRPLLERLLTPEPEPVEP